MRSRSVTTRNRAIWRLAPLGARTAASTRRRRSATGRGSGRNRRTDRWVKITSPRGIANRSSLMPRASARRRAGGGRQAASPRRARRREAPAARVEAGRVAPLGGQPIVHGVHVGAVEAGHVVGRRQRLRVEELGELVVPCREPGATIELLLEAQRLSPQR